MSEPQVWHLSEAINNFITNWWFTAFTLFLIWFIAASLISLLNPDWLSERQLWLIDGVIYAVLWEIEMSVAVVLMFFVNQVPDVPSDWPDFDTNNNIAYFIEYQIPGPYEIFYIMKLIDNFMTDSLTLMWNITNQTAWYLFTRNWVYPVVRYISEYSFSAGPLYEPMLGNEEFFYNWLLSFSAQNSSPITIFPLFPFNKSLFATMSFPMVPNHSYYICYQAFVLTCHNLYESKPFTNYNPTYISLFNANQDLCIRFLIYVQAVERNNAGLSVLDYNSYPLSFSPALSAHWANVYYLTDQELEVIEQDFNWSTLF